MKTKELIEILQRLDPELDVVASRYTELDEKHFAILDMPLAGVTVDGYEVRIVVSDSSVMALDEIGHSLLRGE